MFAQLRDGAQRLHGRKVQRDGMRVAAIRADHGGTSLCIRTTDESVGEQANGNKCQTKSGFKPESMLA